MRPDDVRVGRNEPTDGYDIPIAAELGPLDAELAESGVRARRMLHGRTQPTNYFAMDLRARLLGAYPGDTAAGSAALEAIIPRREAPDSTPRFEPHSGDARVPAPVVPRITPRDASVFAGAFRALVAAVLVAGAVVAGVLASGAIPR
jgi:hypothetical protein